MREKQFFMEISFIIGRFWIHKFDILIFWVKVLLSDHVF